jgi:hypothetical protein
MSKRVPLDTSQFHVDLPPAKRDPLDTLIPQLTPETISKTENSLSLVMHSERKNERTNERPNVQMNERSNVQSDESDLTRVVIRHTFDIFQDQLIDLKRLQIEAMQQRRRKRKLGQMMQQALDKYIKEMKEKYHLQG